MTNRLWDIQASKNYWISLGFHVDHTDPSITFHLPGAIICLGCCKQPGFNWSLQRAIFLSVPYDRIPKPIQAWWVDRTLGVMGYDPNEIGKFFGDLAEKALLDTSDELNG